MANVNPMMIPGRWRAGYVLDVHTTSSTYLGDDEFGRPRFDTTRSAVGELLYQLKYRSDRSVIPELVDTAIGFLRRWKPAVDIVVPVPPSRKRAFQPVLALADQIAQQFGLPYVPGAVTKVREVPELKNVFDYHERLRLLAGAHGVDQSQVQGQAVLLFDDLYRSGATMNAIASALIDEGRAADVFAFAITRTRSKR